MSEPSSLERALSRCADNEADALRAAYDAGEVTDAELANGAWMRRVPELVRRFGGDETMPPTSAPASANGGRDADALPKGAWGKLGYAEVARLRAAKLIGTAGAILMLAMLSAKRSGDKRRKGDARPGDVLLSIAEMARQLGVSRKAADNAIARLVDSGWLLRHGRGRYSVPPLIESSSPDKTGDSKKQIPR